MLLTTALPDVLPRNPVGTRLGFRLVYPDMSPKAGRLDEGGKGRYVSREMGSVVVGSTAINGSGEAESGVGAAGFEMGGEDADKTLEEVRFVIGDFVDCAIFPPLSDGSVVGRGSVTGLNGSRGRENGYGPRGGRLGGYGLGGGRGRGDFGGNMPSGEWRRGERIPDSGFRGGGYTGGRGRGRY